MEKGEIDWAETDRWLEECKAERGNPDYYFDFLKHERSCNYDAVVGWIPRMKLMVFLYAKLHQKPEQEQNDFVTRRQIREGLFMSDYSIERYLMEYVFCGFFTKQKRGQVTLYIPVRDDNGKLLFEKYAHLAIERWEEKKEYERQYNG